MIIERITEATQISMVLQDQGYQTRGGYSNYNPRFNKPNYHQKKTSFKNYDNRFTQHYEQTSLSQTHNEIMNGILKNHDHQHNSSKGHNDALATMHQT